MKTFRALLLGDLIGLPGQFLAQKHIPLLRKKHNLDLVVANGENSNKDSRGITRKIARFLLQAGVDVITTGNHVWDQKDIYSYLDDPDVPILRPGNFHKDNPGQGLWFGEVAGTVYAVIQVQGSILMSQHVDNPFDCVESLIKKAQEKTKVIFLDFHAEATSEKRGMGFFVDSKISVCVGTHTHVPTADVTILSGGTAYITDLGMAGSFHSMIGMDPHGPLEKMKTNLPHKYKVATEPPYILSGVIATIDKLSGKALDIEQVIIHDNQPLFNKDSI